MTDHFRFSSTVGKPEKEGPKTEGRYENHIMRIDSCTIFYITNVKVHMRFKVETVETPKTIHKNGNEKRAKLATINCNKRKQ